MLTSLLLRLVRESDAEQVCANFLHHTTDGIACHPTPILLPAIGFNVHAKNIDAYYVRGGRWFRAFRGSLQLELRSTTLKNEDRSPREDTAARFGALCLFLRLKFQNFLFRFTNVVEDVRKRQENVIKVHRAGGA
jgi:hypothetical protein